MKMRLGICEDDPFTLATLTASLSFQEVDVVISASSPTEALRQFPTQLPHAMIIDLHLGDGPNGIDLARACRKHSLEVGIVFLTSFESPRILDRSTIDLPAGSQYLNKRNVESVDQILLAVQKSISRNRVSYTADDDGVSGLTTRQLEVLELVAGGLSNQEIGKRLDLSSKTIEGIVLRIAKKLDLRTSPDSNQRIQMAKAYLKSTGRPVE